MVAVEATATRGKWGFLMLYARGRMASGLLLAASVLLAQTALAQTALTQTAPQSAATTAPPATPHHKSHKTQKPVVLPPLPSGPLSQLPMDQLPPTPAKVSYQGGLLTISAQNSTLGEILRDVRKLTGASIDIPQNANERVVTHLGPGAPRDVLAALLNGSGFNYVMLGSSSDPTAVASVILMAKPSSPGDVQTAANVFQSNTAPMPQNGPPPPLPFRPPFQQAGRPGVAQPANAEADDGKDEKSADDEDDPEDSADDQAQPPAGQPAQPAANTPGQPQQPDPNQPNAGPKTPEQILEMLRKPTVPGAPGMTPPTQPPDQ